MPGRNPEEAFRSFVEPLEACLRCTTLEHRLVVRRHADDQFSVTLNGGRPIPLSNGDVDFSFDFSMVVATVPMDDGQQRMSTRKYIYDLREGRPKRGNATLVQWHWHPNNGRVAYPHAHLPFAAPYSSKLHVPTGRVTFEDVVEFIIDELGVPPTPGHEHWSEIVEGTRGRHIAYRSWSGRGPSG